MSPTKTKQETEVTPAEALERARLVHDQVLERIGAGANVTPTELVQAESGLRLAELGADAATAAAARAVEDDRLAQIDAIVEGLRSGEHARRAQATVDAFDAAEAALRNLCASVVAYLEPLEDAARRLRALSPLPPHVAVDRYSKKITVDGVRYRFDASRVLATLYGDAVWAGMDHRFGEQIRSELGWSGARGVAIDAMRAEAGVDRERAEVDT